MAAAAVGRMNGRPARPAVTFRRSVTPITITPIRTSAFVRCHSWRRKRQIQPSRIPTTRIDRRNQPPRRAKSGRDSVRPNSTIASRSASVIFSPLRTIVSFCLYGTLIGVTARAASSWARVVRSWLYEELATTSGEMSSAASARSFASSPAIWPTRPVRAGSTSVSFSSARSVRSRTREASSFRTFQRSASSASSVARADSVRVGIDSLRSLARSSAGVALANARSIGSTSVANMAACFWPIRSALSLP